MNTKFKIGEKVIYKNKLWYVGRIIINKTDTYYQIYDDDDDWSTAYAAIEEHKLKKYKPILDNAEKRYLENVIRPFKYKATSIIKKCDINDAFIRIELGDYDSVKLPYFDENTMYKGMERGKEYTIKELGLFEEDR